MPGRRHATRVLKDCDCENRRQIYGRVRILCACDVPGENRSCQSRPDSCRRTHLQGNGPDADSPHGRQAHRPMPGRRLQEGPPPRQRPKRGQPPGQTTQASKQAQRRPPTRWPTQCGLADCQADDTMCGRCDTCGHGADTGSFRTGSDASAQREQRPHSEQGRSQRRRRRQQRQRRQQKVHM